MSNKNTLLDLVTNTYLGDVCRMFFWFGLRLDIVVIGAYFRVNKLMGDHQSQALACLARFEYKKFRYHNKRVDRYIKEADKIVPFTDKFLPKS